MDAVRLLIAVAYLASWSYCGAIRSHRIGPWRDVDVPVDQDPAAAVADVAGCWSATSSNWLPVNVGRRD